MPKPFLREKGIAYEQDTFDITQSTPGLRRWWAAMRERPSGTETDPQFG